MFFLFYALLTSEFPVSIVTRINEPKLLNLDMKLLVPSKRLNFFLLWFVLSEVIVSEKIQIDIKLPLLGNKIKVTSTKKVLTSKQVYSKLSQFLLWSQVLLKQDNTKSGCSSKKVLAIITMIIIFMITVIHIIITGWYSSMPNCNGEGKFHFCTNLMTHLTLLCFFKGLT